MEKWDLPDDMVEYDGFAVDDDDKANWALKKIGAIRAERARIIDACDREIARYQHKKDLINASAVNDENYFTGLLMNYMNKLDSAGTVKRTKAGGASYRLPDGKLRLTPAKQVFEKTDADEIIKSLNAADAGNFIRVKFEPDWAKLKKELVYDAENAAVMLECVDAETGEIIKARINGVAWTNKAQEFKVEVDE